MYWKKSHDCKDWEEKDPTLTSWIIKDFFFVMVQSERNMQIQRSSWVAERWVICTKRCVYIFASGACDLDNGNLDTSKPDLCRGLFWYGPFNNCFVYRPPLRDNMDTCLMWRVRYRKDPQLKSERGTSLSSNMARKRPQTYRHIGVRRAHKTKLEAFTHTHTPSALSTVCTVISFHADL